jgi:uncharacterized membrane protein YwaF
MGFRPRAKEIPKLAGLLACHALLCFGVNQLINWLDPQEIPWKSNYLFLTFPPPDTPLEAFAAIAGPFYIVPAIGLLLIIWVLLFAPWEIYYHMRKV